jgi:hypothetical protein
MAGCLTHVALLAAVLAFPLSTPVAHHVERPGDELSLLRAPIGGEPGWFDGGQLGVPTGCDGGDAAALTLAQRGPEAKGNEGAAAVSLPPGTPLLEMVGGCEADRGGRSASEPRDQVLTDPAALNAQIAEEVTSNGSGQDPWGARSLVGAAGGNDMIAFCLPRAWAAEPCLCSVEGVETAISPGQFILLMRERRAAGATSASEMRVSERHAREICGEAVVQASIEAVGATRGEAPPSWAGRPASRSTRRHGGAP